MALWETVPLGHDQPPTGWGGLQRVFEVEALLRRKLVFGSFVAYRA